MGQGPQKFHSRPTPRIGGLAIFLGMLGVAFYMASSKYGLLKDYFVLLFCSLPTFLAGFFEDITKRLGAKERLIFTMLSALLSAYFLGALIVRVDVPVVDDFLLSNIFFAYAFTIFAVTGVANAINIIDGFNGLAGTVSLIIVLSLGYITYKSGDAFLFPVCLALAGAILGFLVWNYPGGFIFLGDGGAYLLGFLIAQISILLVKNNPEVSPWFPMLLLIYPVTETIFSIYRRKLLKGYPPFLPDSLHFHTLIYKRIAKFLINKESDRAQLLRNSMTSPFLWFITLISAVPGVISYKNTPLLILFTFMFVAFYIWLYSRIVKFKTPKILIKGFKKL